MSSIPIFVIAIPIQSTEEYRNRNTSTNFKCKWAFMVQSHLKFTHLLRLRGRLREPFLALYSQMYVQALGIVQPITQRLVEAITIAE